MFSGIVEETGVIKNIIKKTNLSTLHIQAKKVLEDTQEGSSISVGGVCLTVTQRMRDILVFDIMLETIQKTTLGALKVGSKVNLERALQMTSRISGHFVSGHVDHMEDVVDVITRENYTEIRVSISPDLKRYVVPKGSVCLDGVSLTVGEVRERDFSVYLIPFTLQVTTLGQNKKGDKINVETDILAKYVLAEAGHSNSPYNYTPTENVIAVESATTNLGDSTTEKKEQSSGSARRPRHRRRPRGAHRPEGSTSAPMTQVPQPIKDHVVSASPSGDQESQAAKGPIRRRIVRTIRRRDQQEIAQK